MKVLLGRNGDTILATVDTVEDVKPLLNGHGNRVELDPVDENERCSVNALGSAILPHRAKVAVRSVYVILTVAAGYVCLV